MHVVLVESRLVVPRVSSASGVVWLATLVFMVLGEPYSKCARSPCWVEVSGCRFSLREWGGVAGDTTLVFGLNTPFPQGCSEFNPLT